MRSTGEPTYFASDIAYHRTSARAASTALINVLGADHHGYVARMKAAVRGAGRRPGRGSSS